MSETKASQVKSFLAAANMDPDQIDIEACVENLLDEMRRGLAGEPSSLAMIPTYLNCEEDVPTGKPVIVMDAGGTNVRVCVVEFASDGSATISDFAKYRMPGIDRELSADEFYGELAGFLSPVIAKSDRIGFCFSYPSEISPEKDGKLLRWTKEVKVPEVEGTYIGAGLIEHLGEKGVERKKIVILNDTVATLLAGKAVGDTYGCADYIGFILGTGTNTAYVEKNVNIRKLSGLPADGRMPINMESGNFNKAPMSYIDDRFDATTVNPGCQRFEKMISGAYLGPLALQVLKAAAEEKLFSAEAAAHFESWDDLTTIEMDNYLHNPHRPDSVFRTAPLRDADRECLYHLFAALERRAALLTAVNIGAPVIQSGAGHNPLHPVCITIDGSTYYKSYRFPVLVESYLDRLLRARGIFYRTMEVENAPVIGAAIAGLIG